MPLGLKIVLIFVAVIVALLIALIIYGNHLRKKTEEQQAQIEAAKQVMSMLIIDKKRIKIKDANLPKIVLEQTPKYLRGAKLPIVKAKVGPQIMSLIADEKIFDKIPIKAEVKAEVSGIYIVGIKSVRGGMPVQETTKKKGFFSRFKKTESNKTDKKSKNKK